MLTRKQSIVYGIILGGWFALVYALWGQAINWLFLPGILLVEPQNNLAAYLLGYVVMGMLVGAVGSIPSNTLSGVALGGFVSAMVISLIGLILPSSGEVTVWRKLIVFLYTFLPLAVLLMPVTYIIRAGVNAQVVDVNQPHLWARRYLVVGLISIGILVIASLSLYNRETREAFYQIDQAIQDAKTAASVEQLPDQLKTIQGYRENARGEYRLTWSDQTESFMGPQPAGLEASQFLIIARFENGFSFACIFQPGGVRAPYCTNFDL